MEIFESSNVSHNTIEGFRNVRFLRVMISFQVGQNDRKKQGLIVIQGDPININLRFLGITTITLFLESRIAQINQAQHEQNQFLALSNYQKYSVSRST